MTRILRKSGSPLCSAVFLAGCICFAAANPAGAAVIYEFSLPANGDVGAFSVQLTFPDFQLPAGLQVYSLSNPVVTAFSSGTPIDAASSVVGFEVTPSTTLLGIYLINAAETVLFTPGHPQDFFVFGRTPGEMGLFGSTAGTVISDFALDTATPTASLQVSDSPVPEPATNALVGLGLAVIAGIALGRKGTAKTRSVGL